MHFKPFRPTAPTQTLAPAASSVLTSAALVGQSVRIHNATTSANVCFIRLGTGSLVADATDMPLGIGGYVVIEKIGADKIAVFSAGATVYVTPGDGGF